MRQRKGCCCEGHWRYKLEHYVVTRRNLATVDGVEVPSDYCEVKCRQCQRKWRSKASYVQELPDWEERKYTQLTMRMLLQLIRDGRITADFERGVVFKERKCGKVWTGQWVELSSRLCGEGRGIRAGDRNRGARQYRHVVICHANYRIETGVHRVVWMVYHKERIPKGYDIDHRDNDTANNAISNLRKLKSRINQGSSGWDEEPNDTPTVPF